MTVTFLQGTLEFISANFINPYTGEVLEVEGEYYINDTPVNGGPGNADILLGSTHNQFFTIEDSMGNLLLEDLEIFLMAAGTDILILASDTHVLGDTEIQLAEDNDIVWANVGNDLIGGSLGDDILNGGPGHDTLSGDEDNDTLIGWTGFDTLDGGTGDDILEGGADDDFYMFSPGDGFDIIIETDGFDSLIFTDGILLTDLTFTQIGTDLQIDIDVSGTLSGITITGFHSGDPDLTVEVAMFDDGSEFDLLSLLAPVDLGNPDAIDDIISFNASEGVVTGNVMDNDVASPDAPTLLTQVSFGATSAVMPIDGSDITITGDNGVLTINNTGAYSYTPFVVSPTDAFVFDSFFYVVSDVDGDLDNAILDITTVNDSYDLGEPDAVDDAVSFDVSDGLVTGNVMGNDVDSPDAPTLLTQVSFGVVTVSVPTDGSNITITGDNGVLTINNVGAYSYTPSAIGATVASVVDEFDYVLSDVNGDTDTASLEVTTVNDSYDLGEPDAVDDAVSFEYSDGSTAGNVRGNDVDSPDAPTLLVEVSFGATTVLVPSDGSDVMITGDNGVLTINNLGVYNYAPFAIGTAITSVVDEFDYVLSDVDGDLDTASLEITTVNDAADVITGTTGDDTLFGGLGDDVIDGNTGSDHLLGGDGNDLLIYSNDAVWPSGFVAWNVGAPDAIINGDRVTVAPRYRSHDNFDGGDGIDTIQMGDDGEALFLDDRYSGNPTGYNTARLADVEIIRAGGGDDIVDLTSKQFSYGDVSIYGDEGNDVLWGNAGADYISGGIGNDHLDGASGNDTLFGGSGNDKMYGQTGDDTFIIGEGADEVYTGSGSDLIIYDMIDAMVDNIRDFSAGAGDMLDLSEVLVGYDAVTDAINDFVSITQSGGNTIVSVDADGGADNFVQIATLHGVTGLGDVETLETSGTLITM